MDEGDRNEQLHRNEEAISAVADDGFLVEEDDDYEDLYNDVNVGEGFHQSLHSNDQDLGFKNEEEKKIDSIPTPGVGGNGGGEQGNVEKDVGVSSSRIPVRLESYQDLGFKGGNDSVSKNLGVPGPGPGPGPVQGGNGMRVELGQSSQGRIGENEGQIVRNSMPSQGVVQQSHGVGVANVGTSEGFARQGVGVGGGGGGAGNFNVNGGTGYGGGNVVGYGNGGGGTILFVGDLHWWTTDAELEAELCKYRNVKEVKFFDEKASGKSKGYCQVEFYDSSAATACKEGMNGHIFNGRPCVVAYASPHSVRRMGEAQVNKNQAIVQSSVPPGRRGVGDAGPVGRGGGSNMGPGGNYQGGDGNRSYGRGNWGRGNGQGMGGRGPVGPMRNRIGGMGGRGIMGNGGGNGFGQGLAPTPQMMHPQTMMGQGFDPTYGAPMGRMGGYGGFPAAPTPPFSGMLSSFPPVGGVGLPGVAPHVNPAFFRGMPANGMGMMPSTGMDGHGVGMWLDPSQGGWGGEDPGGRAAESSYGEDAASDHQYADASYERGGRPNSIKEKDRVSERDWSGASDRRYRDDRDPGSDRDMSREKDGHDYDWSERRPHNDRELSRERERTRDRDRDRDRDQDQDRERDRDRDRERHREDRDRHVDHHRYKDRGPDYDDDWDKGRSSRTYSKSRLSYEEDRRSRSRDPDYSKRRRLPSE